MNGIGGDLFAIVYDATTSRIHGLDASGRSPTAATREAFAARGLTEMPASGPLSVDVPGVVSGWDALLTRFGTLTLGDALAPAIGYARDGFPVAELVANEWRDSVATLSADAAAMATFLPTGTPPDMGEICASPPRSSSSPLAARTRSTAARSRLRSPPTCRRATASSPRRILPST